MIVLKVGRAWFAHQEKHSEFFNFNWAQALTSNASRLQYLLTKLKKKKKHSSTHPLKVSHNTKKERKKMTTKLLKKVNKKTKHRR